MAQDLPPTISHQQLSNFVSQQRPPILLVGMHNSGTSILSQILHENGVFMGNSMDHYESHFFSIFINDLMIMGRGNWAKQPIMPIEEVMSFKETIEPFIHNHAIADYLQWGYDGVSPWGIKDPRICVLLPLYLAIFPQAPLIHIRRNPDDVAASLSQKRKRGVGVLDQFEHWKALTTDYTQRVLDYADQATMYHEISYEAFCTQPEPIIRELFAQIDLPFTEHTQKTLAKVTPSRIGSFNQSQTITGRLKKILKKTRRRLNSKN